MRKAHARDVHQAIHETTSQRKTGNQSPARRLHMTASLRRYPQLLLALVDDRQFGLIDDMARHRPGDRALVGSRRKIERPIQRT
jgi:hypothetical protein